MTQKGKKMGKRVTAKSRDTEYSVAECVHCGVEVFVNGPDGNIDELPESITVLLGGGEYLSVDETSHSAKRKSHKKPQVLIKWFHTDKDSQVEQQYMCKSCAESLYGYDDS